MGLLLSSCVGTKFLKPGEKVLYRQLIRSSGKIQKEKISDQLLQDVNSKILGMQPQVYLYENGKQNLDSSKILKKKAQIIKKFDTKIEKTRSNRRKNQLNAKKVQKIEKLDNKLKEGNLRMKWSEKLVIFDSSTINGSVQSIKDYLFSKGYFNLKVTTTIKEERKNILKVIYHIDKGEPYKIDSMVFVIHDPKIDSLFKDHLNEIKVEGKQYEQDLLTNERERVYDLITNNGYYDFKKQYTLFMVDSMILRDNKLVVEETITNPPGKQSHKLFKIDSIIFNTESGLRTRRPQILNYKDVTYNINSNKYSPKLLSRRIFLHKDSIYSKKLTLETQRQISYLDIFKFVNINYDSTGGKFIANVFTSPLKKFQTSSEVGLSVFDQANGLPGPFVNFNAKSRNVFGGFEIIQFDGNASIQGISNVSSTENTYSRLQYGGQLSVTFPQFLVLLKSSTREKIGQYNPRTKFVSGVNFEDRRDEYKRNTFNASMSYIWQIKNNLQFTLKPFDAGYIRSINSADFQHELDSIEETGALSLTSAFKSSFVSFSSFELTVNNNYGVGNTKASYFRGYLEAGGNFQNIFGNDPFGTGLTYYKYAKTNFDYRQTYRLSEKSSLAYRANLGASFVYGANHAMPYEKYFFAGGSNSIRAWNPRRLGPGAYGTPADTMHVENDDISNAREQPGDIILETSVEYRHDLIGFVDYALFLDAGNVWLWKSATVNATKDIDGDDGVFRFKTFPSEIALGAGFGLRFDFSFLVLRFDLAYKIVDPAFSKGNRFRIPDYKFKDLVGFGKTANISIGIGYPF